MLLFIHEKLSRCSIINITTISWFHEQNKRSSAALLHVLIFCSASLKLLLLLSRKIFIETIKGEDETILETVK